ncbi:ADAMTS-like protein 3 isoform X2 [Lineus longissimus]|uniref:ADAMTS-like protein 3 isoform X2 n=1 Tax=Lineus longissimus TaxID=88925 RepID=UPI002B4E6A91
MWMCRTTLLCALVVLFVSVIRAQWTPWSRWSSCTKLCDGGVTKQVRQCASVEDCKGPRSRFKLCNTQPCPENSVDFRDLQCAGYNTKRSHEEWVAYHNTSLPCTLVCRGLGTGIIEEKSRHVVDGTRCLHRKDAICLRGVCKDLGCDGTLDHEAQVDHCGVCRGDGSSCSRYVWVEDEFSPCTVTCGVGRQTQNFYCKDVKRDRRVKTRKCDPTLKPSRQIKTCDIGACTPEWVNEDWSECSQSCGKGIRVRDVFCGLRKPSGMFKRLDLSRCATKRPEATRQCNEGNCPVWHTRKWSRCSVTCGVGMRYRKVYCSSSRLLCPPSEYPLSAITCHTGVVCPYANKTEFDDYPSKEAEVISGEFQFADDLSEKSSMKSMPAKAALPYASNLYDEPQADKPPPVKSKPAWAIILKGPCSTTCGPGIRAVTIECRHYNYRTNTFQTAPTYKCLTAGPRPSDIEECKNKPCLKPEVDIPGLDNKLSPKRVTYLWRYAGFKSCSASCLGGVREAIIDCLQDTTHNSVSLIYCDPTRRPAPITRPCNNVPCPPSWVVKHYGECSVTCGGGVVKLHVECVQRYGPSEHEKVVLPSYRCGLDELPKKGRYCAEVPCPRVWITGSWSACTPMCGQGLHMRDVYCQQKMANGTMRKLWGPDELLCPEPRPDAWKSCKNTECGGGGRTTNEVQVKPPEIFEDNTKLVQTRKTKRMKLVVGGDNTIIPGTSLIVSCPVKNFKKKQLKWTKAGRQIKQVGRVRKSKSGVLMIVRSRPRDTGVYACEAGAAKSNISVHFHSAHVGYSLFVQRKKYLNHRAKMLDQATSRNSFLSDAWTAQNTFNYSMTPYDVVTGDWSHCSSTCGGNGLQIRPISCEIIMEEYFKVVPEDMCARNIPKKLETKKPCGQGECPHWMTKGWKKKCSNKCVGERLAVQHRRAHCIYNNGTKLDFKNCSQSDMPSMERECTNGRCEAHWRVSPWSTCSVKCGGKGIRTRVLQCVWKAGKKPAGRACQHKDRPVVKKHCQAPPCSAKCADRSPYCSIAKKMKLCRYQAYLKLCCKTCYGSRL